MTAIPELARPREVSLLMEQTAPDGSPAVRAVVVYRYPVYRDLITRVLEKAEVDVAGVLGVKEFSRAALRDLRPDVIVVYDPDANNLLRDVAVSALTDVTGAVRRVVCVGSDNEMVVLNRVVYPNPSVEGLIGCVKGLSVDADALAHPVAEQLDEQVDHVGEQTAGSGGS